MSAEYRHLLDENHELRCRVEELEAENAELRSFFEKAVGQRDRAVRDLNACRSRLQALTTIEEPIGRGGFVSAPEKPERRPISFGEIER